MSKAAKWMRNAAEQEFVAAQTNEAIIRRLERTGEDQISLTDPDSRAMAAHTKVDVGHNNQVAVDAKNKLIVEKAVTNQVVDMGLLTQTAEPAREILGSRPSTSSPTAVTPSARSVP